MKELFVPEGEEMDVTPETQLCSIEAGGASASPAPAAAPSKPAAAGPADVPGLEEGDRVIPLPKVGLGMVKAMTVTPKDTRIFNHFDTLEFNLVRAEGKAAGVSPPIVMVKHLAETVHRLDLNKKLSKDRKSHIHRGKVDIGIAVDVGEGLRTCVIRDAANKTLTQINEDVQGFVAAGGKLSPKDMDLTTVAWTVTSLGKKAAKFAVSVLPPGTTGILSVGRLEPATGECYLSAAMCHATLAGADGATMLGELRASFGGGD